MRKPRLVQLGQSVVEERALLAELADLGSAIEQWARRRRLWDDAAVKTPFLHRNAPPRRDEVLVLCFGGPLSDVFRYMDHRYDDFRELLASRGYECEAPDFNTVSIAPRDDKRRGDFLSLRRWQWIQHLAGKRLLSVHSEIYDHFAQHPQQLASLGWRQYEELLDAIFRNQGFHTELGPGSNDGGVDIRLYQSDAVHELVAIVQAKRYRDRPIALDAVAALCGVAQWHKAPRGILATTSRFLPSAQTWALSTERRLDLPTIELAGSQRVAEWCASIARELEAYFLTGEITSVPLVRGAASTELTGRIVVAHTGYNMVLNRFCIVEADFAHEAVLRPIGARLSSGDVQRGYEVPDVEARPYWTKEQRLLAFKKGTGDRATFWGDQMFFALWDGTPQLFDSMD